MNPASVILGVNVKPSDLIPLTVVGTTVLFITEDTTGEEITTLIGDTETLGHSTELVIAVEIKGPPKDFTFPTGGANRILHASFVVGVENGGLSAFPAIQVK